MSSVLTIWNSALVDLGRDTIASLTEESEARRICSAKWEIARNTVIRAFNWRCLAKRATLSRLAAAPEFGWLYQYQIPPDCFAIRLVFTETGAEPAYEVEGRALLTNDETGRVLYTAYDVSKDNAGLFDATLTAVLVKCLAAEIAPSLKGAERAGQMWALYRDLLGDAKLASALEGSAQVASCNSLLSVRS